MSRPGPRTMGSCAVNAACLVLLSLLPAPTAAAPTPRTAPTAPVRIDDAHVPFVYDAGTKLVQTHDGRLWLDKAPRPIHKANIRSYARLAIPFSPPCLRGRSDADIEDGLRHARFTGLDANGHRWLVRPTIKKLSLFEVHDGAVRRKDFGRGYYDSVCGETCPPTFGFYGRQVLHERDGGLVLAGTDRLWRRRGEAWSEIELPVPSEADEAKDLLGKRSPYYSDQLFVDGEETWLVRSFYTNCHKAGSFAIRFTGGAARIIERTKNEFITGLVRHTDGVYFLLTTRHSLPGGGDAHRPCGIRRIPKPHVQALDADTIRRRIAELDSDSFPVRDAASKALAALPDSAMGILQQARKTATSEEVKVRLDAAIKAIAGCETTSTEAELGGFSQAALLFVDRAGRQYVQAWSDGLKQPLLLVADGRGPLRKVPLPGPEFGMDFQGADGAIYAHDDAFVYRMGPRDLSPRKLVALGQFAGKGAGVVGERGGVLCLSCPARTRYWSSPDRLFWLDPSRASDAVALPGKAIATHLPASSNTSDDCPVAAGCGGRLWFVKHWRTPLARAGGRALSPQYRVRTQLCRAGGGRVEALTDEVPTSFHPSVWPLTGRAALVVAMAGNDGIDGCFLYDGGEVHRAKSLKAIVETCHERLLRLLPEGAAWASGDYYEQACLIRLGDAFYAQGCIYKREGGGCGDVNWSGIFRGGRWVRFVQDHIGAGDDPPPLIDRIAGVDARTGRLLGFTDGCKTLRWLAVADGAGDETLYSHRTPAAWRWTDRTRLPRYDAHWILTDDARRHWLRVHTEREAASKAAGRKDEYDNWRVDYTSDDFLSARRWNGGRWRTLKASLYGGQVYEDATGGVWHLRMREAEVHPPGAGASQIVPLDACAIGQARLAVESREAVWVLTQQSLWRFVLQRDEPFGPPRWRAERRFGLQRFAFRVTGPWICGRDLYYQVGDKLFHASLAELLACERARCPAR